MTRQQSDIILEMKDIVKCYGELVANDHINLTLKRGEILALVGENGAGKTTLMKVLYGIEKPTSGEIYIDGCKTEIRKPSDAIACGIGMVQQHFMLFDPFTVTENVVYGNEPHKGVFFQMQQAEKIVGDLSKKYDLPMDPHALIRGMPVGLRQRVEILKVLYQNGDIVIFDEPTAVLTPMEVKELIKTLKMLASLGKSIILITHKLNEVMAVADRAVILRNGKLVEEVAITDTSVEELGFLMVGRKLVKQNVPVHETKDDVLVVKDLCIQSPGEVAVLNHVSLNVRQGEIVGIAGVSGNGQTQLIQSIFGLTKANCGQVLLCGKDITNQTVKHIRQTGAALIPEDRNIWGLASEADIYESAMMGHHQKEPLSKDGILLMKKVYGFAKKLVQEFAVKTNDIRLKTSSLSGGNAQKLIVAREIAQETPLLIACEPTRGVDIGAMEFIHARLVEKRDAGGAVLLVSSELTEILELSDRIYVMFNGRINGEFIRGNVKEEELGFRMAGEGKKDDE